MGRVILSLVIGALIGGIVVHFLADDPRIEISPSPEPAPTEVAPTESHGVELPEPGRAVANSAREAIASEADVLITAALRRHAEEGLRRGWKSVRQDEMPAVDLAEGMKSFEKIVLESPDGIGSLLAERRNKAEAALADAKSGGVFSLLEKLDAGGVGPLPELVHDPEQFEPLFQRVAGEQVRSGLLDRDHPDKSVEDGVTLTWPNGVFQVRGLMRDKDPFPRDVTLAGAGMDLTMLVLGGALMTRESLRNFSIRDCTVHTNNNYLLQMNSQPAAVRFERVRFVGFDMGAGSSCLLGTGSLAMSAKFCRFEGGYGRHPQYGTLFDVRSDGLLARFESCSISLTNLLGGELRSGATVLFLDCKLDEILGDPVTNAANMAGVIFENCSITKHEGGSATVPHLDLNSLFPDWQRRME